MLEQQVNQLIGHLFRHESGKMAAVLARLLGFQALDLAEDFSLLVRYEDGREELLSAGEVSVRPDPEKPEPARKENL